MKTIGGRLREQRELLRMTQVAFADAGGVQKLAQIKYEKGERVPSAEYLSRLAEVGVDVTYVITGVPNDPAVIAKWREAVEFTRRIDISDADRTKLTSTLISGMAQPGAGVAAQSARAPNVAEPAHAYAATVGPDARLLALLRRCSDTDQAMIRALIERLAKTEENNNVADVDDQRR